MTDESDEHGPPDPEEIRRTLDAISTEVERLRVRLEAIGEELARTYVALGLLRPVEGPERRRGPRHARR